MLKRGTKASKALGRCSLIYINIYKQENIYRCEYHDCLRFARKLPKESFWKIIRNSDNIILAYNYGVKNGT